MVGLPSIESRERILKTLMSKEKTEDLDFKELATITEGYTGSDLKVCSFCFSIFQNIYSIHQTNS
jgi:SpoVK/Ycf46/Vps4 family AAA+-type ATPase